MKLQELWMLVVIVGILHSKLIANIENLVELPCNYLEYKTNNSHLGFDIQWQSMFAVVINSLFHNFKCILNISDKISESETSFTHKFHLKMHTNLATTIIPAISLCHPKIIFISQCNPSKNKKIILQN